MRRSRLSAALTLCGLLSFATSAHTEEPKGFQEWPWGTPQGTLIEKFLRMKCRDYLLFNEEGPLKGSLSCDGYQIGDVPLYVLFYFEPSESLAGYWFRFESHYRDMRQTILDKLGSPLALPHVSTGRL